MRVLMALLLLGLWIGPAAAQDTSTWARLQDRDSLRLAVAERPPWSFRQTAEGPWRGLAISIAETMAGELGLTLELVEIAPEAVFTALEQREADLALGLRFTPSRAQETAFAPHPVSFTGLAALRLEQKSTLLDWHELDRPTRRLGALARSTAERHLKGHLQFAETADYESQEALIAALKAGDIVAIVDFHTNLLSAQQALGGGGIALLRPIRQATLGAVLPREEDNLWRLWVGASLADYYKQGRIRDWYETALSDLGLDPAKVPTILAEDW